MQNTATAAALPVISCETTVTMTFRRKEEQFRVFSVNPCSAGASSADMVRRGWEPVMYGCERIVTGRKTAKAVVLAYRSVTTGNFEIAVHC